MLRVSRDDQVLLELSAADSLYGKATVSQTHSGRFALVGVDAEALGELGELDLKDRVVVVYCGTNLVSKAKGWSRQRETQRNFARIRRGVSKAGGKLLAIANDELHAFYGPIPVRSSRGKARGGRAAAGRDLTPAQLVIPRRPIEELLEAVGNGPTAIALGDQEARLVELPELQAECVIEIRNEQAPAYNVVALLEGSDPKLRHEYVAIGCHLDHLGKRGKTIYPGADDDGSGSAGLMAISQAFARNDSRPKRSVLFMAFCGEEVGLVGSSYLAAHPPLPLKDMVAELQIDMIGRNADGKHGKHAEQTGNFIYFVGLEKLSNDLEATALRLNQERGRFDVSQENVEGVFSRSDHFNFARLGIPILFLFTGFHRDYHRATDTIEKINFDKLTRVAAYVYDLGFELGMASTRPHIDAKRWQKMKRKRHKPFAPIR